VRFEGDREGLRWKPSLADSRMTQRISAVLFRTPPLHDTVSHKGVLMAKLTTILLATRLIAVVSASIQLTGCVLFVPGVDDLQFVGVQPVQVGALDLHDTWGDIGSQFPPTDVIG